jgi:REP element-mobilizing transposase RayT
MLHPNLSCPHNLRKGVTNEPFSKIITNRLHCKYHNVWVPKHRNRILTGKVGEEVEQRVRTFSEQQGGCEITELNGKVDHIYIYW